jgi:hypothetical protein
LSPFLCFRFFSLGLFFGLPREPDMLLKLRDSLRYLLAAFQLAADRAQGKGVFFDLGAHVLAAPLAAVKLAPGNNKRVN